MNRPITFRKDIIEDYANRRKALSHADVRDLLRCAINFLKEDLSNGREYAYEIPHIGFMYRKLPELSYKEANAFPYNTIDMMREIVHSPAKRPLVMQEKFLRKVNWPLSLEEVEQIQNEVANKTLADSSV